MRHCGLFCLPGYFVPHSVRLQQLLHEVTKLLHVATRASCRVTRSHRADAGLPALPATRRGPRASPMPRAPPWTRRRRRDARHWAGRRIDAALSVSPHQEACRCDWASCWHGGSVRASPPRQRAMLQASRPRVARLECRCCCRTVRHDGACVRAAASRCVQRPARVRFGSGQRPQKCAHQLFG